MKIIPNDSLPENVDETAQVAPVRKQEKLVMSIIDRKQPVWELDLLSGVLSRPKIETLATLSGEVRKKVITKQNALYCQALNKKNAEKHFSRQIRNLVAKTGMWCRDEEWAYFSFSQKVTLIKKLRGI